MFGEQGTEEDCTITVAGFCPSRFHFALSSPSYRFTLSKNFVGCFLVFEDLRFFRRKNQEVFPVSQEESKAFNNMNAGAVRS